MGEKFFPTPQVYKALLERHGDTIRRRLDEVRRSVPMTDVQAEAVFRMVVCAIAEVQHNEARGA